MSKIRKGYFFEFWILVRKEKNNKMTLNLEILDQNKENKQENFECQDEYQEQIFEKFLSK